MSNKIWKDKWKRNDIAFHQSTSNHLLKKYISQLNISAGADILVPLCGKSLDMNILANLGYNVIGIELSNIAIKAYFEALNVKPTREKYKRFITWKYKNTEIWCGDIFDLTKKEIGHIGVLYDNTSLTAFSPDIRPQYVQHFHDMLSEKNQILLITTETPDETQINSAMTIDDEIQSLYERQYHITLLHGERVITHDPEQPDEAKRPMEEKVYILETIT